MACNNTGEVWDQATSQQSWLAPQTLMTIEVYKHAIEVGWCPPGLTATINLHGQQVLNWAIDMHLPGLAPEPLTLVNDSDLSAIVAAAGGTSLLPPAMHLGTSGTHAAEPDNFNTTNATKLVVGIEIPHGMADPTIQPDGAAPLALTTAHNGMDITTSSQPRVPVTLEIQDAALPDDRDFRIITIRKSTGGSFTYDECSAVLECLALPEVTVGCLQVCLFYASQRNTSVIANQMFHSF